MKHDLQVYRNCAKAESQHFCPVSVKQSLLFWTSFALISIASIVTNFMTTDPFMLVLFAVPAIYLGIRKIPLTIFVLGNVFLAISVIIVVGIDLIALIPMASFWIISLLSRRTVMISQRHYQQNEAYEELFMDTMLSFAKSIDTRDPYTAFHSRNVAEYAKQIATELGLSDKQTEAVYLAGLIHDIGKIGTPEHILRKESRLTEEEYEIMKKHPEDGYEIVKNIAKLSEIGITDMLRHHHERIDGKGYPHGLKGDAIPLGARILATADAFDAMTTDRSYRQKLAVETAAEELRRHSGTQFDAKIASAFLRVLERTGKLTAEREAVQVQGIAAQSVV
jgi:putative nucleotidyltransferase with HDIG domain